MAQTVVGLQSVFDIAQVTDAKTSFLEALERGEDIAIDGGDVERIDAAGLQLLMAVFQEAAARSIQVSWLNKSSEIAASAKLINVATHIGL